MWFGLAVAMELAWRDGRVVGNRASGVARQVFSYAALNLARSIALVRGDCSKVTAPGLFTGKPKASAEIKGVLRALDKELAGEGDTGAVAYGSASEAGPRHQPPLPRHQPPRRSRSR